MLMQMIWQSVSITLHFVTGAFIKLTHFGKDRKEESVGGRPVDIVACQAIEKIGCKMNEVDAD